jgi:hypothetical protein
MMRVGAEDRELGQSVSLLAASCWQGVLYGARSSDSCILVGTLMVVLWTVWERLISLEVQLVKLLVSNSRRGLKEIFVLFLWYKGGSLRIWEWEIWALGWGLAKRTPVKYYSLEDSKSLPTPFSIFLTVPWEVPSLGDPIELNGSGCHENDQVRAGPNGDGRTSFGRTRSLGLTEIVIGWGRIWSACSLRSSLRRLR